MTSSLRIYRVYDTTGPVISGFPKPGKLRMWRVLMIDLKWRIRCLTGFGTQMENLRWTAWDDPFWDRYDRAAIEVYKHNR